MRSFLRAASSAIGLDVGPLWVSAVQVRRDGRSDSAPRLRAWQRLARRTPRAEFTADELSRIMDCLERQGFCGREVVLSTPADKLITGVFELPPRGSGAPLDQISRNELARAHRAEPDEIECGWWEVPQGLREVEGSHVIAVGCRHADAEALLDLYAEADVTVCALDAPAAAIARAVERAVAPIPALTALLELERGRVQLAILRGSTVVYERTIPEGGLDKINDRMVKQLSIDQATADHLIERIGLEPAPAYLQDEAELVVESGAIIAEVADLVANEARASSAYAGRRYGQDVVRVLVAGEGALVPGIGTRLSRKLEIEASILTLADIFPDHPAGDEPAAPFAPLVLAAGLALHPEGVR